MVSFGIIRVDRALCGLLLVVSAVVVSGCGGKPAGQVTGTVQYRGKPVVQGAVNFYSKERGVGAMAKIDPSGTFTFETPLRPGTYLVSVTPPSPDPQEAGVKKVYRDIPRRARDLATSGLTFNVKEGKNEFPLQLID